MDGKSSEIPRAAQYVRMSTEHQKYSTQNQMDEIAAYAALNGILVIRTYADEGRSGLTLGGRPALKALIGDVVGGIVDFDRILVYDVSRWGRFQDADESAHYEFICREAGVKVEYCAEQFHNDGSLMSSIVKNMKRVMAAEYSRELSKKVFVAQCRMVKMGFHQGGPPTFGLRRELLDESGKSKGFLGNGQRKSLQSDRVRLQVGPPDEQELVRHVFRQYVFERKAATRIARDLNSAGSVNQFGRPWTGWAIHCLLKNENYIGNGVYNRTTCRLGHKSRENSPELWIRTTGILEPIVDPQLFLQAQTITRRRQLTLSNREMLARLATVFREKGNLNRILIDESSYLPHSSTYINRFGSLRNAYKLIRYYQRNEFRFIEGGTTAFANGMIEGLADDMAARTKLLGGTTDFNAETSELVINGRLTLSIYVARCKRTERGIQRWTVARRRAMRGDLIIALRTDQTGKIIDYLVLPVAGFPVEKMEFAESNRKRLEGCRFDTVETLFNAIWKCRNDPSLMPRAKRGRPKNA